MIIKKKLILYFFITIISSYFSLIIFETYIRLLQNKNVKNIPNYDKRNIYEFFIDEIQSQKEVYVAIPPSTNLLNEKYFPLSTFSNSKNITCNETGQYGYFYSDRYGFNNPDYVHEKSNVENIIVGDSFGQGQCLGVNQDIGHYLRLLSGNSINYSQGGNGPLIYYATLREYMTSNTKNIIFLFFEGNDIQNLENELKNEVLKNYVNDEKFSQNLRYRQKEIDQFLKKKMMASLKKTAQDQLKTARIAKKQKIKKFLLLYKTRQKLKKNKIKPVTEDFYNIIKLTNEFAKKNNTKLYFVYLPEINRYKVKYNDNNYKKIKQYIIKNKINFIDVHKELFLKEKDPLILFTNGNQYHYSSEGYRKVSEIIYNHINK